MAFAWRRPDRSGLCTGSRRKEVSVDVPVWREPEPRLGRPRRACLAGCPRGSESSEMVSPAVTRALRKSKTLRYGVPMLIDPELEKKLKMNKVSLESEYEKIKDSTFDDWKNIRGPRPWEDPDLLQGQNPEILNTKTA
ncbi:cytochrome c oxidase assembly protein COX16 homolog, mitochondrial isoform 2-T2 [Molossus nigricans]